MKPVAAPRALVAAVLVAAHVLAVAAVLVAAPARADGPDVDKPALQAAVAAFKSDARAKKLFAASYGYAVFPTVGRGALGVGGAYGEGGVYKKGKLVARTTLTQVTIGLGLGGEAYREIVFFKDKAAFDRFAAGELELGARATASAGTAGASTEVGWHNGVAILTATKGGLIADAAVGGQRFTFERL